MQTAWRTRTTTSRPLLYSIAIIAFGVIFWSFRLLHGAAGQAVVNFRKYREVWVTDFMHSYHVRADSLTFDIPPSEPVAMTIHDTRRYDLTPSGVEDYAALLPPGGHLVYFGSPPKAHTSTLFHQMKCLGVIHVALIDIPSDSVATPTPLVSHCLNYLRQMILCRPNLRLESVTNANASSEKEYVTVCRNWETVYAAAEQNHIAFSALHE
jgi:hypothetical protein